MNKRVFISVLMTLLFNITYAQHITMNWAKSLSPVSGPTNIVGYRQAIDEAGSIYTVGRFTGTFDFDPGAGSFNMTSAGAFDIFISKLDSAGNFVWAKRIGSTGSDFGRDICYDKKGNIYLTGEFEGMVDFDPGAGATYLMSSGLNAFFLKLDTGGNFIWAQQSTYSSGNTIVADTSGDVYAAGSGFITKISAAGNSEWLKTIDAIVAPVLAVDAGKNLYMVGTFSGTLQLSTVNSRTSKGSMDVIVVKRAPDGTLLWANQIGGTDVDDASGLCLDAAGYLYVIGHFRGTADFDAGVDTVELTSSGDFDMYVCKLNTATARLTWAKNFGSAGSDQGEWIAMDNLGSLYVTGYIGGSAFDADPGPGTYLLSGGPNQESYLAKYDTSMNVIWAHANGGSIGLFVTPDNNGHIYCTGLYTYSGDMNPNPSVYSGLSCGGTCIFIGKYSANAVLPVKLSSFAGRQAGTTNKLNWQTASEKNNDFFTLQRSGDGVIWETVQIVKGAGNTNTLSSYSAIDRNPFKATYYRLKQQDFDGSFEYSNTILIKHTTSDQASLSCYPNPAGDRIHIHSAVDELRTVQIYNMLGQDMSAQINFVSDSQEEIQTDISSLPQGLYIIRTASASVTFYKN